MAPQGCGTPSRIPITPLFWETWHCMWKTFLLLAFWGRRRWSLVLGTNSWLFGTSKTSSNDPHSLHHTYSLQITFPTWAESSAASMLQIFPTPSISSAAPDSQRRLTGSRWKLYDFQNLWRAYFRLISPEKVSKPWQRFQRGCCKCMFLWRRLNDRRRKW